MLSGDVQFYRQTDKELSAPTKSLREIADPEE
jgi:hypothetical protein